MPKRRKPFTVTLTPSMYDGLMFAWAELDVMWDARTEPQDWSKESKVGERNAITAFNTIHRAYHGVNE